MSRFSAVVDGLERLNGIMRLNGAFWMAIDNIKKRSYSCAIAVWCVCEGTGLHLGNIKSGIEEILMTVIHHPVTGPDMPKTLGPYSQAVRAGDFLYVAGQPGLDPMTGALAGESFEAQASQAFENLSTVLRAAGSGLQHVVKTTIFMADAGAFPKMNELYREYFPHNPPVRSTPIVQLPRGLLISIECVAVVAE